MTSEQMAHPYALLWSPLPPITWILPFIGHMGKYITMPSCNHDGKESWFHWIAFANQVIEAHAEYRGGSPSFTCVIQCAVLCNAGISSSTGSAFDFQGPFMVEESVDGIMLFGPPTRCCNSCSSMCICAGMRNMCICMCLSASGMPSASEPLHAPCLIHHVVGICIHSSALQHTACLHPHTA
jgi:hypothetical protein